MQQQQIHDLHLVRYAGRGSRDPAPKGSVMSLTFQLGVQRYNALNGNRNFTFNDSTSLVACEDQQEVDRFWDALERARSGS